jgi:hypothetical protein
VRLRSIRVPVAVGLAGLVFLPACDGAPTNSSQTVASTSRHPSPTATAPARGAVAASFPSCTLPYVLGSLDSGSFAGGFVSGSRGQWTADPAGQVTKSGDLLITSAQPTLSGEGFSSWDSVSYDAAVKRWLPAAASHVRSDSFAYAYEEPYPTTPGTLNDATRIHVVSLRDGTDRVIYSGLPRQILAYEPEGIYVTRPRYGSEGATDLWLLDATSGIAKRLPNGQPFVTIDHGTAWTDGLNIAPTTLDRIDVVTGGSQNWVNIDGEGIIWIVGLDSSGNPIVDIDQFDDSWLYVYTAPQTRTLLATVTVRRLVVTDSHGTWLAAEDGIYLLKPGQRLEKVSSVTGGTVAGACN